MNAPHVDLPTILVVEDEALIAMMLEDILAGAGYRVVLAQGADAALQQACSGIQPVAAVIDLHLGTGMNGREVLRRLRDARPNMPALVVTGFSSDAPQADLRGLGGPTMRLQKPFSEPDLLRMLADVINRPIGGQQPSGQDRRLRTRC